MTKKNIINSWNVQSRYFALAVLLILGGFFLWYIRPLITPLVVSVLLAYVLHPLADGLYKKTPLSHKASVVLVYLLFLGGVIYIPASVTPVVIDEINAIDIDFVEVVKILEDLSAQAQLVEIPFLDIEEAVATMQSDLIEFLRPETIFKTIESVTENVIWILVVLLVTYYLMADWEKLRAWGFHQFPRSTQPDAIRIYREIARIWRLYLRGQILSMVILGLVSGIAAAIIGLQGPLAIGLVAGALAMLPSMGSYLMILIAGAVSLFSPSVVFINLTNWWFTVLVISVFTGIHIFDNYWLRPKVLGGGLELHEAVVLVGVIGGLTLGGVVLALIIVPLVSSVAVVVRYTLHRIMDEDPWEKQSSPAK